MRHIVVHVYRDSDLLVATADLGSIDISLCPCPD